MYVNSDLDAIQPNPAGLGQGHLMHRELVAILWQKASLLLFHRPRRAYHLDTSSRWVSIKLTYMRCAETRPDDPPQVARPLDT